MSTRSKEKPPLLLIHGGAGDYSDRTELLDARRAEILTIIQRHWPGLQSGAPALDIAQAVIEDLEASPLFNAGYGSVIQSDGLARLSASVMNGAQQKFSGVMLVTHLIHPSKLAFALQERAQTVLGPLGAQLLARELGLPPENVVTPQRAEQWAKHISQHAPGEGGHGTVGVVVLDRAGQLIASTSTGGWTTNVPERVSDVATVAGNYASKYAAISCTGIGEQIVDDAVAARLETRVRDGMSIIEASQKNLVEANERLREYAWIGADYEGNWSMCSTQDLPCAAMSGNLLKPLIGQ